MPQTFSSEVPTIDQDDELIVLRSYERELSDYRSRVIDFENRDPADVLAAISAISARLSEMRAQLWRRNTHRAQNLRTREVDPLREDLDLQFRVWSRRIAVMEFDLRMTRGDI
jgi:hypothetical protein